MTIGGLCLRAPVCFEVGKALLEVAEGIDVPRSLAFSKLSGLRGGEAFFFLLDLVIFNFEWCDMI